eukprot:m.374417 g.374417  ORF g.374417 m.374417 type:complete len:67 (+) comp72313_c0_seq1:31-231(+)
MSDCILLRLRCNHSLIWGFELCSVLPLCAGASHHLGGPRLFRCSIAPLPSFVVFALRADFRVASTG